MPGGTCSTITWTLAPILGWHAPAHLRARDFDRDGWIDVAVPNGIELRVRLNLNGSPETTP